MNIIKNFYLVFILITAFSFCAEKKTVLNEPLIFDGYEVITKGKTKDGTPILNMWGVSLDTAVDGRLNDLKSLNSVEFITIWQPKTREEGAYNHYSCLMIHEGVYYAMWANNQNGEDAPGQRILYSISNDWENWSDPKELFSAPGPILPRGQKGIHLKADRWVVTDGGLYAVAFVHGAGIYPIARKVEADGSYGDPFVVDYAFDIDGYPSYFPEQNIVNVAHFEKDRIEIQNWYLQKPQISWWARGETGVNRKAIDDAQLIESFIYPIAGDYQVLMMRNWGTPSNPVHNNRIYVSLKHKNSNEWPKLYPTDIPDSPSRAEAVVLEDGSILLIGNQTVPYYDKALYLDRDPLTISYSKDGLMYNDAFAYRTNAPTKFRIPKVSGRNLGFGYCSSLVHQGYLYTMYSVGKEDLEISRVELSEILTKVTK